MNHIQYEAEDRHKSAVMLGEVLQSLFEDCDQIQNSIEGLPAAFAPDHWESMADEMASIKKSLYQFGQSVIKARSKNANYGLQQRRTIKEQEKSEPKTSRDNNDWLNGITQQIQETMATLNPGDFVTIVVRKESSETTEDSDQDLPTSFQ